MTMCNEQGNGRLSLGGKESPVWDKLKEWAGEDKSRWDILAAVSLSELCQWRQDMIARHLGIGQAGVSKLLRRGKRLLREAFLGLSDPAPPKLDGEDRPRHLASAR